MRNGTKLKHILADHTIDVSYEGGVFQICLFSKSEAITEEAIKQNTVSGKSWSEAIGKAYNKAVKGKLDKD